jgi:hypothetical protein
MRFNKMGVTMSIVLGMAALTAGGNVNAAPTYLLNLYEESAHISCSNVADCKLYFSAVTVATKITKVSCNFYFKSSGYNDVFVTGLDLGQSHSDKTAFQAVQYLGPLTSLLITNTNNQYQVLADTLHVVPAKDRPVVEIGLSKATNTTVYCSISGTKS